MGEDRLGSRGPNVNWGCLLAVPTTCGCSSGRDATLVMVGVMQVEEESPRTGGQAEVIPGLMGGQWGSQANNQ